MDLNEKWENSTIVRLLYYLTENSHAYFAYTVHKGAIFSHNPINSYALAIKQILHYLKKTHLRSHVMLTWTWRVIWIR